MSSKDWYEYELGQLLNFKRGHDLPKNSMVEGKVPVIGSNGIIGYHNIATTNAPCITIGRSGNIGKPLYINSDGWAHNTTLYVEDYKDNYPLYLYYLLKTLDFGHYGGGSAVPTLNRNHIHPIKVYATKNIYEQKAIAGTLSCLDNMIELNNRTNQVLEEIAQTIFKRWFVDFEFPNEEGEPYKSSGGEMVESELGEIPKGWDIGNLLDIADYLNGLAMQNFRPKENDKTYPVLKIKELRQGTTDSNSELCSVNINQNYIVDDGDLIFSWSGSLIVDFWCGGRCGLNQHLFKVTSNKFDKWYYYYWTNFHLQKFIGIAKDKATTMGHIKREDLKNAKVLIMDNITYQRLNSISNPIFETIIANRIENRKLATIRDTLLPKLMSGEIRVPIEEVV